MSLKFTYLEDKEFVETKRMSKVSFRVVCHIYTIGEVCLSCYIVCYNCVLRIYVCVYIYIYILLVYVFRAYVSKPF